MVQAPHPPGHGAVCGAVRRAAAPLPDDAVLSVEPREPHREHRPVCVPRVHPAKPTLLTNGVKARLVAVRVLFFFFGLMFVQYLRIQH